MSNSPIYSASSACGLLCSSAPLLFFEVVLSIGYLAATGRCPSGPPSMRYLETPAAFTDLHATNLKLPKLPHLFKIFRILKTDYNMPLEARSTVTQAISGYDG